MKDKINDARLAMLCMARQCWEQGVAALAMLETGDDEALILMARDCVVRQNADGRLCDVENTPAIVDPAICVEPVMRAYELTGEEEFRLAAMRNADYLLNRAPRTEDGAIYHLLGTQEIWADSLGMGTQALAAAGRAGEAVSFYKAIKSRLYDEKSGLYRHKWDEAGNVFIRPCFWGVGNGWAMTGLMRAARIFSLQGKPQALWAQREFKALYEAVRPYQRSDGGFHDVLDDPNTFVETEFTEMFAYSVFIMVLLGMLPEPAIDDARKARRYVKTHVGSDGLVHGCAGGPTFEKQGVSVECQAHFLMMEAAMEKLTFG